MLRAVNSLQQVSTTLKAALASDALFGLINTRLTLRTGVDLTRFSPQEDVDAALVARVLETLATLGFSEETLRLVAKKKADAVKG